jgi:hypothetical protein
MERDGFLVCGFTEGFVVGGNVSTAGGRSIGELDGLRLLGTEVVDGNGTVTPFDVLGTAEGINDRCSLTGVG